MEKIGYRLALRWTRATAQDGECVESVRGRESEVNDSLLKGSAPPHSGYNQFPFSPPTRTDNYYNN